MKELFVNLDVPISASLGSSTTTTLTICVGSSSDALCQDINVNLTATSITIQEIHTRTLPNVSLSWNVAGTLPGDGNISWNMISANMVQQGWIWSVDGDFTISGSNIHSTGTPILPSPATYILPYPLMHCLKDTHLAPHPPMICIMTFTLQCMYYKSTEVISPSSSQRKLNRTHPYH